jgi:hypothetical protein
MAEQGFLRIKIAEKWNVGEFEELMSCLEFLRNVAVLSDSGEEIMEAILALLEQLEGNFDTEDGPRLDFAGSRFFRAHLHVIFSAMKDRPELMVHRLQFASPGFADLAGFGKIVEQIRIFLTDIYDRIEGKEDKKIARQMAEQDLLAKKIANAEAMLKLGKRAGLDKDRSALLVAEVMKVENFIAAKVEAKQITGVEKLKY